MNPDALVRPRPAQSRAVAVAVAPEEAMTVSWSVEGAVLLVALGGAVDASLYDRVELLPSGSSARFLRAAVDLEKVTFFGAAGLNFLARLASTTGTVVLLGVPERSPIRWAIQAVGLDLVVAYSAAGDGGATGVHYPAQVPRRGVA